MDVLGALDDDIHDQRLSERSFGVRSFACPRACSWRATPRGVAAAGAVGDDSIQAATRGYVIPDGFIHGSSKQRMRWFKQGLQTGDINSCDTFNAAQL